MPPVQKGTVNARALSGGATLVVALVVATPAHAQNENVTVEAGPVATTPAPTTPAEPPTMNAAEASNTRAAGSDEPTDDDAEVVIAGTRLGDTPGSAYLINNKKLERTEYDDPLAVLHTVPGVYVRTEDGVVFVPTSGFVAPIRVEAPKSR